MNCSALEGIDTALKLANKLEFIAEAAVHNEGKETKDCLMHIVDVLKSAHLKEGKDSTVGNDPVIAEERKDTASFEDILQEMQELYNKKNHDYGNSFSETIQEFGFTPAIARINDKLKRVKQMVKGEPMQIKESMRDNLIDIANYCILTIIELDKSS